MYLVRQLLRLGIYSVFVFAHWSCLSLSPVWGGELSAKRAEYRGEEPSGIIALRHALSMALMHNPELNAFSLEVRAQEARVLQAGLLPNPEIEIEAENFGGSGDFRSSDSAEATIQLSHLVELGGKRSKRKRVASLERDLAQWDYESKRADVLTEVTTAFVDVLASQERVALAEELVSLAERVLDTVSARVKAGKVSPVEEAKARVTSSTSHIALERAKRKLEASRKQLAATWGSKTPLFEKVEGQLGEIRPIPSEGLLESAIFHGPDIARWGTEMEQRQASVALEDAKKISDPTISLGARHFNEDDDNALVLAVSIPIPIFDRNQGGTLEARERLAKADKEHQAAKMRALNDLAGAYQSLSSAYFEATILKRDVLSSAQAAFETSTKGYRQGKFDYLVLLDAQRTLFDAQKQYLEGLAEYHKSKARVERLIASPIDNVTLSKSEASK